MANSRTVEAQRLQSAATGATPQVTFGITIPIGIAREFARSVRVTTHDPLTVEAHCDRQLVLVGDGRGIAEWKEVGTPQQSRMEGKILDQLVFLLQVT